MSSRDGTVVAVSKLSEALTAAGRKVTACPCCGRAFDPHTSYAGHNGGRRSWCSTECRVLMTKDRRRRRARRRRKYLKQYGALIAMHAEEAAGQLSLDPTPLPPVPELSTDDEP